MNQNKNSENRWIKLLIIFILSCCIGLITNSLRKDGIPLIYSSFEEIEPIGEEYISLTKAKELFDKKEAIFIDARISSEYNKAHIKGAINLPFTDFDLSEKIMMLFEKIPPDTNIITYCDGVECKLSDSLAKALKEAGFLNVKVLHNGLTRWKKSGFPIKEKGKD